VDDKFLAQDMITLRIQYLWRVLKLIPYTVSMTLAHNLEHTVVPPLVPHSFGYSPGSSGRLEPNPDHEPRVDCDLRIQESAALSRGAQDLSLAHITTFGEAHLLHLTIDSDVIHADLS
jgi:hypothetical protein